MTVFLLIFFLLLSTYGFLVDYYRRAWNAVPDNTSFTIPSLRVSVVIAVRNEEKNMGRLLDCLCVQDYPKELFEIVLVNDHSEDRSAEIFTAYNFRGINKTIIHLEEGYASKKNAIAKGISVSSGDLIITTDADCEMNHSWVSSIAAYASSTNAKFIAAPVRMTSKKTVLGVFQTLDFITLQGITGASVFKRFHTMCNGANLAYRKSAFYEVNGFDGIDNVPSGDDMLLMHKIFLKYPQQVFYLKNKNATVDTHAELTWKDFFNQRIRWASKAVHYKDKRIFYILLLVYLVNICFLILAVATVMHPPWGTFLLLFFAGEDHHRISVCKYCCNIFRTIFINGVLSFFTAIAYYVHDNCGMAGKIWFIQMEIQDH